MAFKQVVLFVSVLVFISSLIHLNIVIAVEEQQAYTHCPPGSVFFDEQCRKVICPYGEYHNGQCVQATCQDGLVWLNRRCQKPGFVTTIIEIANIIDNNAVHSNEKERTSMSRTNITFHSNKNASLPQTIKTHEALVEFESLATVPSTQGPLLDIETQTNDSPTPMALLELQVQTHDTIRNVSAIELECCKIITPRICKLIQEKWVCFHRKYKQCNPDVCKFPKIYLKVNNVSYQHPLLIMPPNPTLHDCDTEDCDPTEPIDCSGCPNGNREYCSPYCYRYICLPDTCGFVDLKDYCKENSEEPGCTHFDGCIWNWCNKLETKNEKRSLASILLK